MKNAAKLREVPEFELLNTFKVLENKMKLLYQPVPISGLVSAGVAVSKYLEIEVLEESQEWAEHDQSSNSKQRINVNLLIKIALQLAPTFSHRLKMTSDKTFWRVVSAFPF